MTLLLKNVTYTFPKKESPVIDKLYLTVQQGEFVSLIGKSGTGKSTILKLITGLLTADEGEISLYKKPVTLGDVGYMPQKDLLFPWRTILDNIMIGAEIQKEIKLSKEDARSWLKKVGLKDYEQAYPNQLSGGMRQRVAFLRTLLTEKDVLLLDEPFGALDSITKKEMQAWLLSIWQELDKTIIFITHDLEEACYLSDRIILLKDDRTIEETTVPLPRPRYQEMLHSQILLELRKELEKKI
ncbi:ABC transporter ATP-binding protein [Robertmurraya siralis]|uniref:ABC transporter ATP-binding protein n=1 Tax=Robertmurraya siralis TaxID=77777 RepID=A0A920BT86_9BACI|nr:ABC transporter ATP-binding protein [Robertmurraya siralis]GIN61865.1 ABC transporter ATP-binding protein [Robertmurraya siralis]